MTILRMIIGMIGSIIFFVGVVSIWATWVGGESQTGPMLTAIVGALLWLQAVPVLKASDRAERKQRILEELNRKK